MPAVGLFGIASQTSNGHMVTTLAIAMVTMLFTATSYGRMAVKYLTAGLVCTYVSKGLNGNLGFMAGGDMFLDYLIVSVINTIYSYPSTPFPWSCFYFMGSDLRICYHYP